MDSSVECTYALLPATVMLHAHIDAVHNMQETPSALLAPPCRVPHLPASTPCVTSHVTGCDRVSECDSVTGLDRGSPPTCSIFARRFFQVMRASLMELRPRPKYHITLQPQSMAVSGCLCQKCWLCWHVISCDVMSEMLAVLAVISCDVMSSNVMSSHVMSCQKR
jgi:hypothetical protein